MVAIKAFEVENWMDEYELKCKYNIAETCCDSISISQLQALNPASSILDMSDLRLDYGDIPGSLALRSNLAAIYSSESTTPLSPDNILTVPGAIMANYLFLFTHVGPGDHVICHHPTYQQLYSVPESLGAEVTLWETNLETGWKLDPSKLEGLLKPNTKLIILNNPQNPTGAVIPQHTLEAVVEVAKARGIIVMVDEVYRPLFHSLPDSFPAPASILSLGYDNVVCTGSLSKAYSLAGLRTGWIASRNPKIISSCYEGRNYTTISVSKLNEAVAAYALSSSVRPALLERNITLAQSNLNLLEEFVSSRSDICAWIKPFAGTTAFIKFSRDGKPVDDVAFCKLLLKESGVMFVPGSLCFGEGEKFKGFVRIGFVPGAEVLKEGLEKLAEWMEEGFERLPLA